MTKIVRFPSQSPTIADNATRQRALDTHASWIVEAPAGSGKTGLLMQRYLKLLGAKDVAQPEEVLAITFTRKATAELRERILNALEAAERNLPLRDSESAFEQDTRTFAAAALANDRERNWSLLANPQRLRIRTIDSVCAEIANALPLLSGSGGARRPVEDAGPLYRLAAERTLLQLGGANNNLSAALRTVLLHRDGSLSDCEALLASMLGAREQWGELVPLNHADLDDAVLEAKVRPKLERSLEAIVAAGLARALHAIPPEHLRDLTTLAQRLSTEPGYKESPSPLECCADRSQPPEARAEHLEHWLALIHLLLTKDGSPRSGFSVNYFGLTLPKAEKPHLQSLIAALGSDEICAALCAVRDLPPARYPDDQWHVAKALFHLLLRALVELKLLFAERGECDFTELALAAREALRADGGSADLSSSTGATLRHLLVDEMQDTSSSQYELIEMLMQSWDGHSQTLFLVGDPKQSIYLFRQARVERFLRTMRNGRLGDVPVQPLYLTSNFRSQAKLVDSFNHDFSRIFPSEDEGIPSQAADVPFVAASAVREPDDARNICWHTAVLGEEEFDRNPQPGLPLTHATEEARQIRRVVEQWQATPLPPNRKLRPDGTPEPWRIAVLARARHHLAPILAEFERSDGGHTPIPFRAVKVEALGERIEVLDILALTRALLHPADRAAWLAVLHAPWCGLGLADLLALTGEGPDADQRSTVPALIEANAANLSATGRALLDRAWRPLATALAVTGRDPLAVRVERTWRSLGGDAALQPEQIVNVKRFLSLLGDLEQPGGWLDLDALQSQIEGLYAEPSGGEGAVELMTIHSAKGLEWDVVLVPALEKKVPHNRSELLNWLELDGSGGTEATIVLAPIHDKGGDPSMLYRWLSRVRQAREKAERKRLYYVACTRAREELHLFAACKRSAKSGDLLTPHATLLAACWPAAEEHFATLVAASSPADLGQPSRALLEEEEEYSQDLALAAAAAPIDASQSPPSKPPLLHRLPLDFHPLERFNDAAARALEYTPASALRHAPAFERPDGSFTVRAFGSVVHRYLQVLSAKLAAGTTPEALLAELSSWQPRLIASLRAEGLPPALCKTEGVRALHALTSSLTDPDGRWLLSPRSASASERSLTFASPGATSLRVDRTFLSGSAPLQEGDGFLWIIDFKTTQQGSRSTQLFDEQERSKYTAQLESYATALRSLPDGGLPIILALYYPLIPRLIYWPVSETRHSFAGTL